MKITVVCDVYGKENNGSAVVAYNLIRFLQSRGHDVRILCADQESKGLPDHYVVPNMHFGKKLDAYVAKVGVSIAHPKKQIIKEALKGVDAVHIMMPLPLGLATVKIAKRMKLDSIGQEKNQETDAYGSDIKISYAGGKRHRIL